jgi:hypothetical protein
MNVLKLREGTRLNEEQKAIDVVIFSRMKADAWGNFFSHCFLETVNEVPVPKLVEVGKEEIEKMLELPDAKYGKRERICIYQEFNQDVKKVNMLHGQMKS